MTVVNRWCLFLSGRQHCDNGAKWVLRPCHVSSYTCVWQNLYEDTCPRIGIHWSLNIYDWYKPSELRNRSWIWPTQRFLSFTFTLLDEPSAQNEHKKFLDNSWRVWKRNCGSGRRGLVGGDHRRFHQPTARLPNHFPLNALLLFNEVFGPSKFAKISGKMQCYLKLWAGGKVSRTFVVPFWQTMEYMREGSRIVYLFRLRSGSCMSSFAHLIAEEAGIPESTI